MFLHGLSLNSGQQIEGKIINQENNKEPVKSRKKAFQDRQSTPLSWNIPTAYFRFSRAFSLWVAFPPAPPERLATRPPRKRERCGQVQALAERISLKLPYVVTLHT